MDTPMEDMSTTHSNASRPNQGANMAITDVKIIPMYGVLYFGCSFENASGKIFARDIANNRRLEEIMKPFNPVKIPIDKATAKIRRPIGPSNSPIAAPVPQT